MYFSGMPVFLAILNEFILHPINRIIQSCLDYRDNISDPKHGIQIYLLIMYCANIIFLFYDITVYIVFFDNTNTHYIA